jgi:hypothetical protein
MKARELYTTDHDVIAKRVAHAGLTNVFGEKAI